MRWIGYVQGPRGVIDAKPCNSIDEAMSRARAIHHGFELATYGARRECDPAPDVEYRDIRSRADAGMSFGDERARELNLRNSAIISVFRRCGSDKAAAKIQRSLKSIREEVMRK